MVDPKCHHLRLIQHRLEDLLENCRAHVIIAAAMPGGRAGKSQVFGLRMATGTVKPAARCGRDVLGAAIVSYLTIKVNAVLT